MPLLPTKADFEFEGIVKLMVLKSRFPAGNPKDM